MASRRTPRQERSVVTVEAIVTAADRILQADGLPALTSNRIAEGAGVSVGTLYQYFADKHAICRALIEHYVDRYHAAFCRLLEANRTQPVRTAVSALFTGLAHLARGPGHRVHEALFAEIPIAGALELRERNRRRYQDALAEHLRGRADVVVRDPAIAAELLIVTGMAVAQQLSSRPPSPADAVLLSESVDMAVAYLRPSRGST